MEKQNKKTNHLYLTGGEMLDAVSKVGMEDLTEAQRDKVSGVATAASGSLPAIAGGNTSLAGNIIEGVGAAAMLVNPLVGLAIMGAGALTNAAFGSNVNEGLVDATENQIEEFQNDLMGSTSYEQLAANLENKPDISNLDLGTQGWLSNAVDKEEAALQRKLNDTNMFTQQAANNIGNTMKKQMMATAFKNGGNINIKPENRGKFTKAAESRGMGVQESASKVLANKEEYSPLMVKRANFARNASKWNALGGALDNTFTNGVVMINNGGTHEQNPNDGVRIGVAPDGRPNLVEEGEVIFNNYVYSNRLKVPKYIREKYHLSEGATYADAFKKAQKESEERPNDPISRNGLLFEATFLANSQELERNKKQSNEFALGGRVYKRGTKNLETVKGEELEPTVVTADNENLPEIMSDAEMNNLQNYLDRNQNKLNRSLLGELTPNYTPSWLRYVEPAANIAAVTSDLFGLTNTPTTYNQISRYSPIQVRTLGDYIQPELFDRNYWTNQLLANQAATRSAVANTASPAAAANVLAADYNAGLQLGQLARQGQEYNREQALKTAEFNRGTNQANAQLLMEAANQNARNRLAYDEAMLRQAKLNTDETNVSTGARAANISALASSIANIGREQDALQQVAALANSDAFGVLNQIMKALNPKIKAKGGKINTKKKGLTY